MAGSYSHVVNDDGGLGEVEEVLDMLENGGDVYEAIEEMYGMIWYLAEQLENKDLGWGNKDTAEIIEDAQENHTEGLAMSPTPRYRK